MNELEYTRIHNEVKMTNEIAPDLSKILNTMGRPAVASFILNLLHNYAADNGMDTDAVLDMIDTMGETYALMVELGEAKL